MRPEGLQQWQSTIEIASAPADVAAEELRNELVGWSERLQDQFPRVPEALHVVALLYADLKRTTEAEKLWRACIELNPKLAGPYVGLATAAMALGKDELALSTLQQALAHGCSGSDIHGQLGAALTKLGRLEEAEAALQRGLAEFPGDAENWLQLGHLQIQLARYGEAEASLRRAIHEGTTSDSVYYALATACARQEKDDEAARYRQEFSQRRASQKLAEELPFQARYDAELRRIAVATLCRAAAVYDRHGQLAEAESAWRRAADLDPANPAVCGELGTFLRRVGRVADARVVHTHLVRIDPTNPLHYANLASVSAQLGDHDQAESALKHLARTWPHLSLGYSGLAQFYLMMGNHAEARRYAETALRMESIARDEAVRTHLVLVEACRQLGDNRSAESALRAAQELAEGRLPRGKPGTGPN